MPRRIMEGTVVSDKQDKTVTVRVTRRVKDPLYGKFITKSAKFAAHDENNSCKEGDIVRIEECRPLSKRKTWRVLVDGEQVAPVKKPASEKPAAEKTAKKETKKAPAKKPAAKKETKKEEK